MRDKEDSCAYQDDLEANLSRITKELRFYIQGKKEAGGFDTSASIDRTKKDLNLVIDRNNAQITKLESEINSLESDLSKPKIQEDCLLADSIWNPWIKVDNQVLAFLDLKCVDETLQSLRENDYQKLFDSYQEQIFQLHVKYEDVLQTENGNWPLKDHLVFKKIHDEYASQAHRRLGFLTERVKMELKGYSTNDINVSIIA